MDVYQKYANIYTCVCVFECLQKRFYSSLALFRNNSEKTKQRLEWIQGKYIKARVLVIIYSNNFQGYL